MNGLVSKLLSRTSEPQDGLRFKKMSDAELVREMFLKSDQLPMAWAKEMISRGARLIPSLANVLLSEHNWCREDAGAYSVIHAANILGAIGGELAVAPLIYAMRSAADLDVDWISEAIPSIFGNIGPSALPYLKEAALDREEGWYLRERAMGAMAAVTINNPERETEVFAFISGICQDATEDDEVRSWAGNILMEFGRREYESLLMSIVDSGVTKGHYLAADVRSMLKKKNIEWYKSDWLEFYDSDRLADGREELEKRRLSERRALEEAASVEWGENPDDWDGFENDEDDFLDEDEDISESRPRMRVERTSFDMGRIMRGKNFKSIDEANAFLKTMQGKKPEPPAPLNAWEKAQDVMYDAWESEDPKQRSELAGKALAIYPDCADAYNLLGDDTAETPEKARELYEKAMRAGERQLGAEYFKENEGRFWGMIETRPYMRARFELARCLWILGERDEAIAHWQEMLRLNPSDNQGVRYVLASYLGELGRFEDLQKLLDRPKYKDDYGLEWMAMKVLAAFVREGSSPRASELLKKTIERNRFLSNYLLGTKTIPRRVPGSYAIRSEEEAICCAADVLPAWSRIPKALEWVQEVIGVGPEQKIGRNEPCPCGSGKKYKKCCLDKEAAYHA